MNSKTNKMVYISLMATFAIVLGYVETLIPMPTPVPYIKLGLGNVIVLTVLYIYDTKDAFFVSLVKIFVSALLFSGVSGFMYSFSGGMISILVMALLKKTGVFSIIGVSLAGGVAHMMGQIIVAVITIDNINLSFFVAPLILAGAVTGIIVGTIARLLVIRMENIIEKL